jgi:hypothetical protein
VFSGTDVPPGKHEEGEAILSPRPKRISCELPKGSQLFYASIATAATVLCGKEFANSEGRYGSTSLGIRFSLI